MTRWTNDFWNGRHLEPARPPARRGIDWTILVKQLVAVFGPWLIILATILFLIHRLP